MDEEKQRIKIAKACGWRFYIPTKKSIAEGRAGYSHWIDPTDYFGKWDELPYPPNYLNDLNAMADAIAYLTPEQIDTFAIELSAIVLENPSKAWWDLNANEVGHVITATAAQRAEAFLRTLNLWEE